MPHAAATFSQAPPNCLRFARRPAGLTKKASIAGVTLLEVVISAALVGIAIIGLAALNSQTLLAVRNQKQNILASSVLLQRMETLRNLPWASLSDPAIIKTTLETAATEPAGLRSLEGAVETVSTEAYTIPGSTLPAATGNKTYSVNRPISGSGSATVSGNSIDSSVPALRVTSALRWTEGTRSRQLSNSVVLVKLAHQ